MTTSLPADAATWTTVGWAAMTETSFKASKQEASSGEQFTMGRLQYFYPCPMTAIYECRKAAVRELGGTLSEGPVRRKSLKSCHVKDMEGALMSPNFIVFELLTNANMPELVASCTLLVSRNLALPYYHLPLSECPFFPGPDFQDLFKLRAKLLSCGMRATYVTFLIFNSTIKLCLLSCIHFKNAVSRTCLHCMCCI